jgi:hypothetical protein
MKVRVQSDHKIRHRMKARNADNCAKVELDGYMILRRN